MDTRELIKKLNKDIQIKDEEIKSLRKLLIEKYDLDQEILKKNRAELATKIPFYSENELLIYKISQITGISIEKIYGKSRIPNIITARFACYWALYDINKCRLTQISKMFRVHHTSVLHGIQAFRDRADFKHNYEYHLVKEIIA